MEETLTSDLDPFSDPELLSQFQWHCEPRCWTVGGGCLRLEPDAPTDFWQRTHYGFQADNGHFLYRQVMGDFVLTARILFRPVHQYDQAGIMVRVSADCWLKSSVEFEPSGPNRLGVVVTNHGYSDWSTQDFPPDVSEIRLRLRREMDDYLVDSSNDGKSWTQLRMAHLHQGDGGPVACGVYACCPKEPGLTCEFREFSIARGADSFKSASDASLSNEP